jgi:tyrosyl-tRNA synthetase
MSSSRGNYIAVADSEETIQKKMQKAFCPPTVRGNPVLQIMEHHIFPRRGVVVVRRPSKYGGDRAFSAYAELERAYGNGEIHPLDLKRTTAECLAGLYRCVRERFTEGD